MKTITGVVGVGALGALLLAVTVTAGEQEAKDEIAWKTIGEAMAEGASMKKMVLLDVYTDWCGWCKRMDKATYSDPAVREYMASKFVAGKMNPDKEGKITFKGKEMSYREFSRSLGISGYPATAFFTEEGEVLTVVAGYFGPEDFLKLLTFLGEGHYKTTEWENYKKQ